MKRPSLKVFTGLAWAFAVLRKIGVVEGTLVPFAVWLLCEMLGLYWYGKQGLWIYLSGLVALILPGSLLAYVIRCIVAGEHCVPL